MTQIAEKTQCPACAAKGNDNSQDNLVVYVDGSAYCYACQYTVLSSGKSKPMFKMPVGMPMPEKGWVSKAITLQTCNKFGVSHVVATNSEGEPLTKPVEGGEGHTYVGSGKLAFPYYDIDTGMLIAAHLRLPTKPGEKKDMPWIGDTSKVTFFGTNNAPASASKVVLVEGESDTLTIAQAMPDVAVFGVTGASHIEKAIRGSLHVLKKFKQIVLAFDNDTAGQEATKKAMALLPPSKTMIVTLPSDTKDVNELLVGGKETELRRCIRDAKQVTPKGVVDGDDLLARFLEDTLDTDKRKGKSTGFRSIDLATGGLVAGKMITIIGGTGSGKSYFAESIAVNTAMAGGTKTFYVPLEMTDVQVMQRMVQQTTALPIAADPDFDPKPHLDQLKMSGRFITSHVKFLDHFGALDMPHLLEACEFAIDAYGCELIVLDHLTAASDSLDWKDLDKAAKELKQLAIRRRVCVLLINHISRDENNEDEIPKLKHIRGGNGVAQWSDCVFGIGRKRSENTMGVRTIKVDRMTGRFVEFVLNMADYKLSETGDLESSVFTNEEIDEYEYDDTVQRDKDGQVPQQVREPRSPVVEADGVRASKVEIHSTAPLHTGLPTSEWHTSGVQGVDEQHGQKQDGSSSRAASRLTDTVPLPDSLFEAES